MGNEVNDEVEFDRQPIAAAIGDARRRVRRSRVTRAAFNSGAVMLTAVGAAALVDVVFSLPPGLRWAALVSLIAVSSATAATIWRALRRPISDEYLARRVEEQFPELDNSLINSVQFGRIRGLSTEAPFVRRELRRASDALRSFRVNEKGEPDQRPVRRRFALSGAAWLIVVFVAPQLVRTALHRLVAPWREDLRPYAETSVDVSTKGGAVQSGQSFTVSATLANRTAGEPRLHTRSGGTHWRSVSMQQTRGAYRATLERLRADTEYYVEAGGYRSVVYRVRVRQSRLRNTAPSMATTQKSTPSPQNSGAITGTQTVRRSPTPVVREKIPASTVISIPPPRPRGEARLPTTMMQRGCPPEYRELVDEYFAAIARR